MADIWEIIVDQPYSTEGNGGRKLVRLDNGWLVVALKDTINNQVKYYALYKGITSYLGYRTISGLIDVSIISIGNNVYSLIIGSSGYAIFDKFLVTECNGGNITTLPSFLFNGIDSGVGNTYHSASMSRNIEGTEIHITTSSKTPIYPNSNNIRYAKSSVNPDGEVTWSAVEQLTTSNGSGIDCKNPTVVSIQDKAVIIYDFKHPNPINEIRVMTWDGLKKGGHYVIYSGGSYTQSSPSAVVDKDGAIHVAWESKDSTSSYSQIRYAKSIDGGVNWVVEKLTNASTYEGLPSITVDKNNKISIVYLSYFSIKEINNSDTWSSSRIIVQGDESTLKRVMYPSTLFDSKFEGQFGDIPPTVYLNEKTSSVEYIGTYTTNQAPIVTLTDANNNAINPNQEVKHTSKQPLVLTLSASDADGEPLQYSVWVRGAEYQAWTSFDAETTISIASEDLLLGNNTAEVRVSDGKDTVSVPFVVRNLTPESYSQKHVYDLIVGWM